MTLGCLHILEECNDIVGELEMEDHEELKEVFEDVCALNEEMGDMVHGRMH